MWALQVLCEYSELEGCLLRVVLLFFCFCLWCSDLSTQALRESSEPEGCLLRVVQLFFYFCLWCSDLLMQKVLRPRMRRRLTSLRRSTAAPQSILVGLFRAGNEVGKT